MSKFHDVVTVGTRSRARWSAGESPQLQERRFLDGRDVEASSTSWRCLVYFLPLFELLPAIHSARPASSGGIERRALRHATQSRERASSVRQTLDSFASTSRSAASASIFAAGKLRRACLNAATCVAWTPRRLAILLPRPCLRADSSTSALRTRACFARGTRVLLEPSEEAPLRSSRSNEGERLRRSRV